MTNRIVQKSFAPAAFPRRIEDDPRFNGWNRSLPRLWYLDQRQATRLDAESLYGASQYAVFYNRTQFTQLSEPVETATIGVRGYYRPIITDIGIPQQVAARIVEYHRTLNTDLSGLEQSVVIIRPSGGPVGPIVHPILGASIGEGQGAIEGDTVFYFTATILDITETDTFVVGTMARAGQVEGIRLRRTGGDDAAINFWVDGDPVFSVDMSLPHEGVWYSFPTEHLLYTGTLETTEDLFMEIASLGVTPPTSIEIEVTFRAAPEPLDGVMSIEDASYGADIPTGDIGWLHGAMAGDGKIYFTPAYGDPEERAFLVIDTVNHAAQITKLGSADLGGTIWMKPVLHPTDGKLYFPPSAYDFDSGKVLVIDPSFNSAIVLQVPNPPTDFGDGEWGDLAWSGGFVLPSGDIIFTPSRNTHYCLRVSGSTVTWDLMGLPEINPFEVEVVFTEPAITDDGIAWLLPGTIQGESQGGEAIAYNTTTGEAYLFEDGDLSLPLATFYGLWGPSPIAGGNDKLYFPPSHINQHGGLLIVDGTDATATVNRDAKGEYANSESGALVGTKIYCGPIQPETRWLVIDTTDDSVEQVEYSGSAWAGGALGDYGYGLSYPGVVVGNYVYWGVDIGVVKLDTVNGTAVYIPTSIDWDTVSARCTRGVEIDGLIYWAGYSGIHDLVVFDPSNDTATVLDIGYDIDNTFSNSYALIGIDSKLYVFGDRYDLGYLVVEDLTTTPAPTHYDYTGLSNGYFKGATLGPDDKIYLTPFAIQDGFIDIGVVDPDDESFATTGALAALDNHEWSGYGAGAVQGDVIWWGDYNNEPYLLTYDTTSGEAAVLPVAEMGDIYQYAGWSAPVNGGDGKLYAMPGTYDGPTPAIEIDGSLDPETDDMTDVFTPTTFDGANPLTDSLWTNGVLAGDGRIYWTPGGMVEISPGNEVFAFKVDNGETYRGDLDNDWDGIWGNGVLGEDGKIYLPPIFGSSFLVLSPGDPPPAPDTEDPTGDAIELQDWLNLDGDPGDWVSNGGMYELSGFVAEEVFGIGEVEKAFVPGELTQFTLAMQVGRGQKGWLTILNADESEGYDVYFEAGASPNETLIDGYDSGGNNSIGIASEITTSDHHVIVVGVFDTVAGEATIYTIGQTSEGGSGLSVNTDEWTISSITPAIIRGVVYWDEDHWACVLRRTAVWNRLLSQEEAEALGGIWTVFD